MKINLKPDSNIFALVDEDDENIFNVHCNGTCKCYAVTGSSSLHIIESGQQLSALASNVKIVTDSIDDIILYHSDALKAFQDSQKPQPESEPIEPQIGE